MSDRQTMDALVIEEWGRVALRRMPVPEAAAGTVVVKVHYSGVSVGTETLQGTNRFPGMVLPFIAGYQAAGEIAAVGESVPGHRVGDPVAIFCRGSHAAYAMTTAELVHRLDSLEEARLASLFVQPSVGANALDMAEVKAGDAVLVIGQGLIGQATAQLAKLRGAFVATSDLSPRRLAVSRDACSDWTIDANLGPMAQQTKERFPGGFDVVIESTGFAGVLEDAISCVTYNGRFVFVGYHPGMLPFPFETAHRREIHALFPVFIGKPPVRQGVLRLLRSGAFRLEPLISHRIGYREAEPLYQSLFTPARAEVNGIVIDWREAHA
jgi:2-desacetyl-2-hydroxyethyl bacteriochlorophyllide A dehydrogenase